MDGVSSPEEIIITAKEKGLVSVALTDHGVMNGISDFYLAAKKHGVKAIYGMEAYCFHSLREWRELKEKVDYDRKLKGKKEIDTTDQELTVADVGKQNARLLRRKGHLVILPQNRTGLSNLYQISYKAYRDAFYIKPRADKELLSTHINGLIASSACMGGVISNKCWQFRDNEIEWSEVVNEAKEYDAIFGRGKFFLEMQFNESPGQRYINECMVKIHNETGIPLTITTDSHYIKPSDWETQEVLYMLRNSPIKTYATRGPSWNFEVKELYLKSHEEMWQAYKKYGDNIPENIAIEAFENTLLMDSLIDNFEPDTSLKLPKINIQNKDPFRELGERAIKIMKERGLDKNQVYVNRLLYELKIIKEKGFSDYFLITQEIVRSAKEKMLAGSGRGSSSGSIICYLTGITDIDPIKYDLPFERFLDPSRFDQPDIDMDFEDPDQVKEILRGIYGEDNVACISNFGTFQIKGLLKDLARVNDLDHNEINKHNKKIEAELMSLKGDEGMPATITVEMARKASPTLDSFLVSHPGIAKTFESLNGRNRHVSRHAAGVVIGENLYEKAPLIKSGGIVQIGMTEGIVNKNLSAMGFIKFDILGIATLSVVNHCLKLISKKTGKNYKDLYESIRPDNIDFNDQKVLKHVFWENRFSGIFQFNQSGIRKLAMKIKPDGLEDIAAIISLYRPGPLGSGMDELYIQNKFNPDKITYDHPILEEALKTTNNCLIYQEQVLQIANKLGNIPLTEVNKLRKLLTKKAKGDGLKELENYKKRFVVGCEENGYDKADELWEKLAYFSGYGFSKNHAFPYAALTFQTAYLSTYYPLEFYTSVITCAQAGELQEYVSEIKSQGIKVLPIDINLSKSDHVIEGDAIRLSFKSAKGVGEAAVEKIVANQPYTDFIDFIDRSKSTKTAIEPLIKVGAFNCISNNNTKLAQERYDLYNCNQKFKKKLRDEYVRLSNELDENMQDYPLHEKVFLENEVMGFSLVGSPFDILNRDKKIEDLRKIFPMTYSEFMVDTEETDTMLPVVIKEIKEKAQRNGGMMAFIKFGTPEGLDFESVCFAGLWEKISSKANKAGVYLCNFYRKLDNPTNIVVGRTGQYVYRESDAEDVFMNIDNISL